MQFNFLLFNFSAYAAVAVHAAQQRNAVAYQREGDAIELPRPYVVRPIKT